MQEQLRFYVLKLQSANISYFFIFKHNTGRNYVWQLGIERRLFREYPELFDVQISRTQITYSELVKGSLQK